MVSKSSFLVINWITEDGEREEVAVLDYWQACSIVEAMKPHKAELLGQLNHYKEKQDGEEAGIYILEQRYKSAEETSDLMFSATKKMREHYQNN